MVEAELTIDAPGRQPHVLPISLPLSLRIVAHILFAIGFFSVWYMFVGLFTGRWSLVPGLGLAFLYIGPGLYRVKQGCRTAALAAVAGLIGGVFWSAVIVTVMICLGGPMKPLRIGGWVPIDVPSLCLAGPLLTFGALSVWMWWALTNARAKWLFNTYHDSLRPRPRMNYRLAVPILFTVSLLLTVGYRLF